MRDLLTKDLGWKLFSLLLAIIIWLTVHRILQESSTPIAHGDASTLTYNTVPVFIVAAASDVHLYRVTPSSVAITVSGPADVMSVLQANQVRATVDLTDIDSVKDLKRHVDVSVPSGVTLVSVEPAKVDVVIPEKR